MRPVSMAAAVQWSAAAFLAASLAWFVGASLHWPLVGDASLMHYIILLKDHGFVPYRDIGDMNFPGAYLPDWIAVHMPGPPALIWRIYDLLLLCVGGTAIATLARPASWLAGFWAAALFALIHGGDGLYQVGQRDFTIAVLLLAGTAILLNGDQTIHLWRWIAFGLCTGAAATIKPIALPFLLLCLVPLWHRWQFTNRKQIAAQAAAVLAGCALPLATATVWLYRHGALRAFLHVERTLAPLHAALGRRSLSYLLQHGVSPLVPVVAVWLLLLLMDRRALIPNGTLRRQTLLLATMLGLLGYVMQGKGYPYHRYATLGFLLTLIAHDADRTVRRIGHTALARGTRGLAAILILGCAVLIGGGSVWRMRRFEWRTLEFNHSLEADLRSHTEGAPLDHLSEHIQCLDSISGCTEVMNHLRLLPTTGLLYDEFLFHSAADVAVSESRMRFFAAIQTTPPQLFVVTAPLFPDGPNEYRKLDRWPEFTTWLQMNYTVAVERPSMRPVRMGGAVIHPAGYRIYVRRP